MHEPMNREGQGRARPIRRALGIGALALAGLAGLPGPAPADFLPILVDGDMNDWIGVTPVHVDPAGDQGTAPLDLERVFVVNDDRFVYLRFDIGALHNLQALPVALRIHVDTDASAATGYAIAGIGSDLMIHCSGSGILVYEQLAGRFDATYLGHEAVALNQAPTVAGTEFEMRIARGVALPQSGLATFAHPTFRIVLEAPGDRAPDADGGIACTIATGTPPPDVGIELERADPWHVRLVSWNAHGDLFGADSLSFRRVLRAIAPDVVGFQEVGTPAALVAARLDRDLPLGGGARWTAFAASPGQVTASRWPQVEDPGAPSRELATLVDLPDVAYPRDLYLINGHWKCCGSIGSSEDLQRQETADATVDWIRGLRSGGLPYLTPIVLLGDLNLVGGPQPLATVLEGDIINEGSHGPDFAPDWDDTPLTRVAPVHTDALAAYTWRSDGGPFAPGILDHVIVTDAVAGVGRRFILDTRDMSAARLARYGLSAWDSQQASDHLPVVVDLAPGEPAPNGVASSPWQLRLDLAPNPVRGRTRVRFVLPTAGTARVDVFDVTGRRVRTLARGALAAGPHRVWWDVREEGGAPAANGVYFVRVALEGSGASAALRRLVVVR